LDIDSSPVVAPRPWHRRFRRRLGVGLLGGLGLFGGAAAAGAGTGAHHGPGCDCRSASWLSPPAPSGGLLAVAAPILAPPPAAPTQGATLRVATYNLHSGLGPRLTLGTSREVVLRNLERIADAIAASAPADHPVDIVGLNEVDFVGRRSGGVDEAQVLADLLQKRTGRSYAVVGGVTWERTTPGREVRYGNAVLTRHPVLSREVVAYDADPATTREGDALPSVASPRMLDRLFREARGAVKVSVALPGAPGSVAAPHAWLPIEVLVTHLDAFSQGDREAQAVRLLRQHVTPGRTTLLLGDLNAVPAHLTLGRRLFSDDLTHDLLTSGPLVDARVVLAARDGEATLARWATFPVDAPEWPLDGALATCDLVPVDARPIGDDASDHLGLAATFRFAGAPVREAYRAWHDAVRSRQLDRIDRCALDGGEASVRRRSLVAASGFRDLASR
jgi:endonuclease/exonuclease/phosphatase family metal-dependent hydrolase